MVKLVVENDPKEIAQRDAFRRLEKVLKNLAANLFRVSRGAGKPFSVASDCAAVIEAYEDYRNAVGHYPTSHEVSTALDFKKDIETPPSDDPLYDREFAIDCIISGSLQLVASKFLGQRLQISAGEKELIEGVRELEAYRERQRQLLMQRPGKKSPRKSNRRRKPRSSNPKNDHSPAMNDGEMWSNED
ncbi:hypothetical protein [Roseibium sp.]|uniref:hypothetical protein n=1 Tax=Roseibium sp. TaxID=1936156 RepID=UPI003B50C70D